MFSSINVSVEYPNNTIAWLWALVACADAPNRDSATFLMDQEGLIKYFLNADTPFDGMSPSYGIPINDTLFLNKTFTAGGNSDGASIGSSVTTVMSSFATAPTGQVVFSDDARRMSELGLKLMSLVVVLGAFLLF
ncbi:hypothetical protein BDP27DRAFT_1361867 [Rhodocollybia butyracea]|uniref:Uncharacterized protein n=1 Tax=Rhodocollybia butyracea TaxID=206335 RepID=A0A9P5U9R7_9AGAR|nr:hypothetical protein BDP27DRAFT_1361867 [Rhodocollybia butyracea]